MRAIHVYVSKIRLRPFQIRVARCRRQGVDGRPPGHAAWVLVTRDWVLGLRLYRRCPDRRLLLTGITGHDRGKVFLENIIPKTDRFGESDLSIAASLLAHLPLRFAGRIGDADVGQKNPLNPSRAE